MTQLELKALVASLNIEDRRRLRELLDESVEDDPIYHIAEVAAAAQREFEAKGGVSTAPTNFAANHDKYIHSDILNINHD